jgi:hypothetical protein
MLDLGDLLTLIRLVEIEIFDLQKVWLFYSLVMFPNKQASNPGG